MRGIDILNDGQKASRKSKILDPYLAYLFKKNFNGTLMTLINMPLIREYPFHQR